MTNPMNPQLRQKTIIRGHKVVVYTVYTMCTLHVQGCVNPEYVTQILDLATV